MSALPREAGEGALRRVPMTVTHLDEVVALERSAYDFPWSRGNFIDSLAAGYRAEVLLDAGGALVGYSVAMPGVDEMHLLNVTVRPQAQGRGHGRALLDALVEASRARGARQLWLEVREGNARARRIYEQYGFVRAGVRRGYYPAPLGRREDAIVMSLSLGSGERDGVD
jgi:[ribosomal protein S18]-alanine N-acetyltransferase